MLCSFNWLSTSSSPNCVTKSVISKFKDFKEFKKFFCKMSLFTDLPKDLNDVDHKNFIIKNLYIVYISGITRKDIDVEYLKQLYLTIKSPYTK